MGPAYDEYDEDTYDDHGGGYDDPGVDIFFA